MHCLNEAVYVPFKKALDPELFCIRETLMPQNSAMHGVNLRIPFSLLEALLEVTAFKLGP